MSLDSDTLKQLAEIFERAGKSLKRVEKRDDYTRIAEVTVNAISIAFYQTAIAVKDEEEAVRKMRDRRDIAEGERG